MERIREVVVKQQQDLAEARQREQGYKASTEYDEESLYGDKGEGGGGFAGADPKKRRGVCSIISVVCRRILTPFAESSPSWPLPQLQPS